MDRVHLDIAGPFPRSQSGNRYLLVIMDQFTKWVEIYPISDQTAETTVKCLTEFVLRMGMPLQIHTDQGRNFESGLFSAACNLMGIVKTRTTPYRPSSNGQVERFNRSLLKMVRCYVNAKQDNWDQSLGQLGSAYRSTPHRMTGFTPNLLMLGREVRRPCDIMFAVETIADQTVKEYMEERLENMEDVNHLAREHLKEAQVHHRRGHDVRLRQDDHDAGDLVLLRDLARKVGHSPKLQAAWKGPYVVSAVLSPALYRIVDKKTERVVHHDAIKSFQGSVIPLGLRRIRHGILAKQATASTGLETPSRLNETVANPTIRPGDDSVIESEGQLGELPSPVKETVSEVDFDSTRARSIPKYFPMELFPHLMGEDSATDVSSRKRRLCTRRKKALQEQPERVNLDEEIITTRGRVVKIPSRLGV